MSDIDFYHLDAVGKLQQLIDATAQRQAALNQQVPHFPQAAAGRDFTAYAQSVQSILARIHQRRNIQLHNITRSAVAAIGEYDVAKAADDGSAGAFRRFDIGDVQ